MTKMYMRFITVEQLIEINRNKLVVDFDYHRLGRIGNCKPTTLEYKFQGDDNKYTVTITNNTGRRADVWSEYVARRRRTMDHEQFKQWFQAHAAKWLSNHPLHGVTVYVQR